MEFMPALSTSQSVRPTTATPSPRQLASFGHRWQGCMSSRRLLPRRATLGIRGSISKRMATGFASFIQTLELLVNRCPVALWSTCLLAIRCMSRRTTIQISNNGEPTFPAFLSWLTKFTNCVPEFSSITLLKMIRLKHGRNVTH
jgi:hypothetical protein